MRRFGVVFLGMVIGYGIVAYTKGERPMQTPLYIAITIEESELKPEVLWVSNDKPAMKGFVQALMKQNPALNLSVVTYHVE